MTAIATSAATTVQAQPTGLAYNLPDLQAEAHAQFGMTRDQVLSIACSLYERGLITYPYVEERLLPLDMFDELSRLVRGYRMASGSRDYDPEYRGPVWVDEVPGAHTGITLTMVWAGAVFGTVSADERRIYGLVHARFLEMFRRPAAG